MYLYFLLLLSNSWSSKSIKIKQTGMSQISHVVDGEASESESEIEIGISPEILSPCDSAEPFVIAGEAPESDDESKIPSPLSPDVAMATPTMPSSPRRNLMRTNYNSLLHQRLWECNVGLRATVEGLLRHTTDISVEKLSHADKTLLSVQESMRQTNANLTLARARLKQLHLSLENGNCAGALPTVKLTQ